MIAGNSKKGFLFAAALLLGKIAFSQPPPPPPPGNPPCWPPPCVPVDNGLIIALAAAVLFGAFMLYRKVKAQPAQ